jgi:heme exporter protein A
LKAKQRTGARALVEALGRVGAELVFGYPGGNVVDIFDELISAMRADRTFVMVSHDLSKGFHMCTHALVLARGRVALFAPKDDLDFDEFSQLYHATVGMGVA